jgi:hypothetical protein
LVEPTFATLQAIPGPWSRPTGGRRVGEPVLFQTLGRSGLSIDDYIARYKGKLRGKILMLSDQVRPMEEAWRPVNPADLVLRRSKDEDLAALRQPLPPPAAVAPLRRQRLPHRHQRPLFRSQADQDNDTRRYYGFLRDEGVVAWLNPTIGDRGTIVAFGPFGRPGLEPAPPPGFNMSVEDYNRVLRLMQHGVNVKIEVELESELLDERGHTNVLGEIRGTSRASDVILAGAHLDSYHVGTGATDNAGNCAVLLEAMRILKASGLPLARYRARGSLGGRRARASRFGGVRRSSDEAENRDAGAVSQR